MRMLSIEKLTNRAFLINFSIKSSVIRKNNSTKSQFHLQKYHFSEVNFKTRSVFANDKFVKLMQDVTMQIKIFEK